MPPVDCVTLWVYRRNVAEVGGQVGYVQAERCIAQALIARGVAVDLFKATSLLPEVEGFEFPRRAKREQSATSATVLPASEGSADHDQPQPTRARRAPAAAEPARPRSGKARPRTA
ncbi:hypothetical protein QTI33_03710 [Variovorax sp. J22P271]|uniref:hypothetical protein n=1 Tax=Variovorax davisae TaxID=3053515 RepID=UPI002577F1CB|nr:hypothetical protein [Variovorax sp. J22P271]MDM0031241.1 hypothetical protein [Variovorax sp. J22P271]